MTIRITDRMTGKSYDVESALDPRLDWADRIGVCFVEAYGQTEIFATTVYERVV